MRGLTLPYQKPASPSAGIVVVQPMPTTINSLQAGRACAAILVVLFHASVSIFALPKYWGEKPFGRLFDFGSSGVVFFFVLSGFIILQVHQKDLGRPERILSYLWKRFRRVYPIYWLILLAILPVYIVAPGIGGGFETRPRVILSSFLLVHLSANAKLITLDVAWTLFHEVLFYGMFALAMWRVRLGFAAMAVWFATCLCSLAIVLPSAIPPFYVSQLNVLFGFGMAASWWMRRRVVPFPAACAAVGLAIYLLAGAHQDYWGETGDGPRGLVFGVGTTLVVLGIVELERSRRLTVPAWLRRLGDASYAIYLVHFFVLSLLAKLVWASGLARLLPAPVFFVAFVSIGTVAGVLCHRLLERPLLAWLRQRPARDTGALAASEA